MNETLRDLIARFPCAHPNRTETLHHVLVVLGSGFQWHAGEAVYGGPLDRTCHSIHQRFQLSDELVGLCREQHIALRRDQVTGTCPAEGLRERAAELATVSAVLPREPYPPSSASLLLTLPLDITPDWAAAAREIAAVIGPQWAAAARETPVWATTPEQQAYARRERGEALRVLCETFGEAIVTGRTG